MDSKRYAIQNFGAQIKRHKYIILGVITLLTLLIGGLAYRAYVNNAWNRAIDYHSRSDYDQAYVEIKDFRAPDDPQRLEVYSQTMLATNNLDQAATGYEKLYSQNSDPSHKLIMGNIKNEQGDAEAAAKVYQEVIDDNPNFVQAYVNLATLYKTQNNQSRAVEVAQAGREANPQNVVLHELTVSLLLNDKDSDEYKQAVEQLRELNPNSQLLQTINED